MLRWLGIGRVRATEAERAAAAAWGTIESGGELEEAPTFVAGGRETRGALYVATACAEGAVYSARGRGYAPYNEDGAFLFRSGDDGLAFGVFDQAGGLGGSVRGAASGLAAATAAAACRVAALEAEADHERTAALLAGALAETHERLVARHEGEVTTAVVGRVGPNGHGHLVTSGDSAALRFAPDGRFLEMTLRHEGREPGAIGCLTHALGLTPEGPDIRRTEWVLQPGEVVIACSDGLLDAGLAPSAIGRALAETPGLEKGLNELLERVLWRMGLGRAKPDNLTVVALRWWGSVPHSA